MNLFEILKKIGYDIISINNGVYTVKYTNERIMDMVKEAGDVKPNEDDLYDTFNLVVKKVGFNGFGNLSVTFQRLEYPDENWDYFEYRNMDKEYL